MSPEPKEFEHTNSASRPVLWACVGSFGRISYSVTRAPRVAACQAASDPAKPPPMTTTSSRICLNLHRIRIVRTAFERCQADSRIPDPSLTDLIRHVRLAGSRGRLAQRKSASLTRKRPLVRYQYRPPYRTSCEPPASIKCGRIVLLPPVGSDSLARQKRSAHSPTGSGAPVVHAGNEVVCRNKVSLRDAAYFGDTRH